MSPSEEDGSPPGPPIDGKEDSVRLRVTTPPTGNAPVQCDGVVDGKNFYFRARGSQWALRIGGDDVVGDPEWLYYEDYGTKFEAGYMSEEEAYRFIGEAVVKYRQGHPSMRDQPNDPGTQSILDVILRALPGRGER
jgi:hypothetical protein